MDLKLVDQHAFSLSTGVYLIKLQSWVRALRGGALQLLWIANCRQSCVIYTISPLFSSKFPPNHGTQHLPKVLRVCTSLTKVLHMLLNLSSDQLYFQTMPYTEVPLWSKNLTLLTLEFNYKWKCYKFCHSGTPARFSYELVISTVLSVSGFFGPAEFAPQGKHLNWKTTIKVEGNCCCSCRLAVLLPVWDVLEGAF